MMDVALADNLEATYQAKNHQLFSGLRSCASWPVYPGPDMLPPPFLTSHSVVGLLAHDQIVISENTEASREEGKS
jgi:hypothetical protein